MSAVIRLFNHLPSQSPIPESLEEQFGNINSPELPLEQKLASAFAYIMHLQTKIADIQEKLRRTEREVAMRDTLLRNAALRERELRSQMVGQ